MRENALQRRKVNRAINFMRSHSSEQLNLEQLADVACLSTHHFSRVFRAHCNETPISFLTRTRLEQSAFQLGHLRDKSVTEIAFDSGFSSPEAFSRAFHRRFGIQPRIFRNKNPFGVYEFPESQFCTSILLAEMNECQTAFSCDLQSIQIEQASEIRLAYVRHQGSYFNLSGSLEVAFDRLEDWAKMVGIWNSDSTIYGVCQNSPALTPPQFCQYDVGIQVDSDVEEDEFISIQTLPASTIAKLTLIDGFSVLNEAWRWFNTKWLPENGKRVTDISCYELHKTRWNAAGPPQSVLELCMPIQLHKNTIRNTSY